MHYSLLRLSGFVKMDYWGCLATYLNFQENEWSYLGEQRWSSCLDWPLLEIFMYRDKETFIQNANKTTDDY